MINIGEFIIGLNKMFILLLTGELLFFILIEKSNSRFKFRWKKVPGTQLKPYIKTIVAAAVFVAAVTIFPYIQELIYGDYIETHLQQLGLTKNICVSVFFVLFTIILACYYTYKKAIDQRIIPLILIMGLSLYIIFFT